MSDGGDFQRWICDACGYIYDEAKGDPDSGLAPGTRFDAIPNDWECPLCGLRKADLRLLPDAPPAPAKPRIAGARGKASGGKCRGGDDYIVIVGAGIAGWSTAEAIRQRDPDVPLLMVSACEGITYAKPALSTALTHGKAPLDLEERTALERAAELRMDIRTGTRVLKIDLSRKRLTTASGGIQYGELVLALGAQQRKLPVAGDASDAVMRVNDLQSYRRLRARLDEGAQHVTILGAGLIGCEFAEDLSGAGYQVSVVDPQDEPLSSLLPEATARALHSRLAATGITWHLHNTADAIEHDGDRLRVTLANGDAFETDLVLSAAGLVANTALATKAGLDVGNGVLTDRDMRSSNLHVYAVGDCAEVEGHIFAYIEPIRRQAESLAACLRGESSPFDAHPPLVRVKTPSYPLSICPPWTTATTQTQGDALPDHLEYFSGDELVGFVLADHAAQQAGALYRQVLGQ